MSYARFLADTRYDRNFLTEIGILENDYDRNSRKNSLSKLHMHSRGERARSDYRIANRHAARRLLGFFGKYGARYRDELRFRNAESEPPAPPLCLFYSICIRK